MVVYNAPIGPPRLIGLVVMPGSSVHAVLVAAVSASQREDPQAGIKGHCERTDPRWDSMSSGWLSRASRRTIAKRHAAFTARPEHMCYTYCVQSCRIGGAGGVPPPPRRPSAWARPFPPEVAPTSCLDSCYGRPVPRRATSCERRCPTAEAEPLGERGCPRRGDLSLRAPPALPVLSALVGRPGALCVRTPAAMAPCALTGFRFGGGGRSCAGGGFGGRGRRNDGTGRRHAHSQHLLSDHAGC